jgi:hypothetical protein
LLLVQRRAFRAIAAAIASWLPALPRAQPAGAAPRPPTSPVEKVLAGAIDERSPYHDAARRAEGLRYRQAMIDNAIDLLDAVDAAVAFVQQAVRHLRKDVAAGRLEPPAPLRLTELDAEAAGEAARRIAPMLARVRAEVLRLERFYRG